MKKEKRERRRRKRKEEEEESRQGLDSLYLLLLLGLHHGQLYFRWFSIEGIIKNI